jgi:hypothetical protein
MVYEFSSQSKIKIQKNRLPQLNNKDASFPVEVVYTYSIAYTSAV